MRTITRDITLPADAAPLSASGPGTGPQTFRLTKPDAFSGVELLRLLFRFQEAHPDLRPTVPDLLFSLSGEELRAVMTSCLNHVAVLLPAGPQPVMTGPDWGYPELRHDTAACLRLVLEEIAFALDGFFAAAGSTAPPAAPASSP